MEITFKDITRIIKKNIVFIAVLSLLCAAASYFVTTFFVPKTYTSTVKLYVETNYKSQFHCALCRFKSILRCIVFSDLVF